MRFKFIFLLLVVAGACQPTVQEKAPIESFHLSQVQLLPGPFYEAQQTDLQYILEMDVDRLLAPYLTQAGLEPVKPAYGNWEGDGLNGHIGGHYLSALSMMYSATGNKQMLERLNYMIDWLEKCQQANGNGYVGGVPQSDRIWNEIANGNIQADYFSLNGGWVPLYNIHKIFAGLRDAYLYTGNNKALTLWIKLSDWWLNTTGSLSEDQLQQMLKSEHGGLNEVFADLYAETGEQKYLEMAKNLSHRVLLNPLMNQQDSLTGMHANTQIPKVIGYQRVAGLDSSTHGNKAASFFWNTVVNNRTVAFGGNSVREHFHNSDDFSSMISSEQGPETCNTYNMLRLSNLLFLEKGETKYMDYYERGLYNHILSSQHPDGGFVYFTPARPRHYRVYSQPHQGMWCCVGSGLENHTKYGEMIYAHQGNDILVNLFIPSVLNWEEKGIIVEQKTEFPYSEITELTIKEIKTREEFTLKIRKPEWINGKAIIKVNGEITDAQTIEGYFLINRKWNIDDKVSITLPMSLRLEYLPDGSSWAAYMRGPILMASKTDTTDLDGLWADDSRMGHVADGDFYPIDQAPVLVGNDESLINLDSVAPMQYSLKGKYYAPEYNNLSLVPFYQIHEARYMMYWAVTDSLGLEKIQNEIKKEEEDRLALKAITIDYVKPGEQQPEADHFFKGEKTYMGYNDEKYWRSGTGWFSYELRDPEKEASHFQIGIMARKGESFQVFVNGELLKKFQASGGEEVFKIDWPLSLEAQKYEITFLSDEQNNMPRVFDVRLLSAH